MVEIKVDDKIYEVYARNEHSLKKEPHIRDKATGEVVQNQISIARKFLESIGKYTKDDSNTHWHIEQILKPQIQKELDIAKNDYMLKLLKEKDGKTIRDKNGLELVALTIENVAKVEAMIQNDSAYRKSTDKLAKPIKKKDGSYEYNGSTAYWMTQLKNMIIEHLPVSYSYEQIIKGAIEAVDRENSTHLTSDGCGREQILKRLLEIKEFDFIGYLKEPINSKFKLINIIAKKTEPTESERKGKRHLSFASKFCHYACFYLFDGKPEQDNYSIYDYVLRKAIPKYINLGDRNIDDYNKYFRDTGKSIGEFYKVYYDLIGEIIKESGSGISRNGFDHLLWYYYKGRYRIK